MSEQAEGMVERVEKAIADVLGYDLATLYKNKSEWNADRGSRHDINVPYRGDITDGARAAIEAMRELSPAMMAEAMNVDGPLSRGHLTAVEIWHLMIDAALKPEGGET